MYDWFDERILVKNSYVEAYNGYFRVIAYCRLPSNLVAGDHVLWAKPDLRSKVISLKPATTTFTVVPVEKEIKIENPLAKILNPFIKLFSSLTLPKVLS